MIIGFKEFWIVKRLVLFLLYIGEIYKKLCFGRLYMWNKYVVYFYKFTLYLMKFYSVLLMWVL